jgi:hypothetical protein
MAEQRLTRAESRRQGIHVEMPFEDTNLPEVQKRSASKLKKQESRLDKSQSSGQKRKADDTEDPEPVSGKSKSKKAKSEETSTPADKAAPERAASSGKLGRRASSGKLKQASETTQQAPILTRSGSSKSGKADSEQTSVSANLNAQFDGEANGTPKPPTRGRSKRAVSSVSSSNESKFDPAAHEANIAKIDQQIQKIGSSSSSDNGVPATMPQSSTPMDTTEERGLFSKILYYIGF